jgi:hypothetical protein
MHIPNRDIYLPRRTFLRGLGVAIGLPPLECMLRPIASAAGAFGPPKRMVFVYLPNGMHMPGWTPSGKGSLSDLPATLQPLATHQSSIQVLSGLAHVNARPLGEGAGDHARANACFPTGIHPRKTAGADIHVGISDDQFAAQQIGTNTRLLRWN